MTFSSTVDEEALIGFRLFLQARSLRNTEVREAIVRAALLRPGHFSVEELTSDLQERGIDVSRATVYRALPLLLEAGLIQPTVLSCEQRLYEVAYRRDHHDHLICSCCEKIIEFQFEAFEMLQREIASKYQFELTAHFHELIGICNSCKQSGSDGDSARGKQKGAPPRSQNQVGIGDGANRHH